MTLEFLKQAIKDCKCAGSLLPSNKSAVKKILKLADLKPGDKIADAGAGTGVIALAAAEKIGNDGFIFAIELNDCLFDVAKKNIEESKYKDQIELIKGDAHKIGEFMSDKNIDVLDTVISTIPITWIEDPVHYLSTLKKSVKSGGKIIQETYRPWTTKKFFKKAGLKNITTHYVFINPLLPGAVITGDIE